MAERNHLTDTLALAVDNDRKELDAVLALTSSTLDLTSRTVKSLEEGLGVAADPEAVRVQHRVAVAGALKERYHDKFLRLCQPDDRVFTVKVAGMLLNEVVGEIDWFDLAAHYISKVAEYRDDIPAGF